jgi:hypothetical protein
MRHDPQLLVKGVIFAEKSSYGPVLIEDTEVAPPDLPWWENIGRSNFFAYRVNSHGGEGVIKCDTNCEAKDNWVHGMELGGAYHYNAFGGNGTDGFRIEHNYATCGDWSAYSSRVEDAGCSAVIGFYGDYGPIQNITITKNYLASTFRYERRRQAHPSRLLPQPRLLPRQAVPEHTRNLTVTDNVFARGGSGKCGVYGPTNSLNKAGAPKAATSGRTTDSATARRSDAPRVTPAPHPERPVRAMRAGVPMRGAVRSGSSIRCRAVLRAQRGTNTDPRPSTSGRAEGTSSAFTAARDSRRRGCAATRRTRSPTGTSSRARAR